MKDETLLIVSLDRTLTAAEVRTVVRRIEQITGADTVRIAPSMRMAHDVYLERNKAELLARADLTTLSLSTRALNVLQARNIFTLGDLAKFTRRELLEFPNLGRAILAEIEQALASKGFQLRES